MTFGFASLSHEENVVDWTDHPDLQRRGEQEDLWQVVQHLTSHLDANPQDARAYFLRGNAYLDQRCFDLARDDYNNLGLALSDLGEFAAAVQAYTQAITIDAHDWHAYNNRGLALWALGRREDARRDYAKAKELIGD